MTWRPKRKVRKSEEHDFQAKTLKPWLDLTLPRDAFWTAVDHSGGGYLLGALRKAKGAKDGLPDVWIIWRGKLHCMELKAPKGDVADNQLLCTSALAKAGAQTWLVRTLAEAQEALDHWAIPLRARLEPRSVASARLA